MPRRDSKPTPSREICADCGATLREHPDGYLECPDCPAPEQAYSRYDPARLAEVIAMRARAGDTDAAFRILQDFVGAIDQHDERTWRGPTHWAYAQYIAEAFEQLVRARMNQPNYRGSRWDDWETGEKQADANIALGIKNSRPGRRKGTTTHDEEALAAALNLLLLLGLQLKQAKSWLQKKTGADPRTIERANKEHPAYAIYWKVATDPVVTKEKQEHAMELIKVGAEPYAAEIEQILAARTLST